MTTQQQAMIRFAARHDWGQSARVVGDGVQVSGTVRGADGSVGTVTLIVTDMQQLRDWAGY